MPQQRRAQLTRRAIVVAAAEEFDRAGYDAVPLSTILHRSGVTKGAFYFHFSSKESLALALVRLQAQRWPKLQHGWLRQELDPLSIAVGLLNDAARLVEQDVVIRAGTRLACHRIAAGEESRELEWEPLLQDLLRRSAAGGLLRPGVDPMAVARVAYTALVGANVVGSAGAGPGAAARMEEVWRITLRGVASPEWLSNRRSR